MHLWINGWDWGWVVLLSVWVVLLAAVLFAAVNLTNGPKHRSSELRRAPQRARAAGCSNASRLHDDVGGRSSVGSGSRR